MKFVSDPPIAIKIEKMKQRVRWQHPQILQRGIDQTRMVFDRSVSDSPDFSFLVVGDSGSGPHRGYNPQRQIAEMMLEHQDKSRFVLHTGDVIYLVGSSEYYPKNFIEPYREFLVGGEEYKRIAYDKMVFKTPFLPVPGNHDYYDLPLVYGIMAQAAIPLRRLLRSHLDFDIGLHGSYQGKAYAQAFLDYLLGVYEWDLGRYLDNYYTASTDTGRCLLYQPGRFTRLPNRYYTFRSGGIDFFALDSSTFNSPPPLPSNRQGDNYRRWLEVRLEEVEKEKMQIIEASTTLNPNRPEEAEQIDDWRAKLEQLEEIKIDIQKQLTADEKNTVTDFEQLNWLRQKLIESWNAERVRGRVIYFHHPPYVTEATKWNQGQTLTIRRYIRWVLDGVAEAVGSQTAGRPLVDLILNGHAHCLEYLRTGDTGHGDSHLNWIVCGGSGYSLRRQRVEGSELMEAFEDKDADARIVAKSELFVGRTGQGLLKRRPYSFLRIDVKDGRPPKFIVRPFTAERFGRGWKSSDMEPFAIG